MMVLCTQVNKMYVIATLSVYPHRAIVLCTGAGAGILTYFAGAGVCSPPVKL